MDCSVIVPVYNEEKNIPEFLHRTLPILEGITSGFEVIFAMDPSSDRTEDVILNRRSKDPRIKLLKFSRRFGQPMATLAGLQYCQGEAAIVIDVNLQDPPELIREMVAQWRNGCDVVMAQRRSRSGETLVKRIVSYLGYRLINKVAEVNIPPNTGDFRLLSRRVVDELVRLKECHGFLRGLVALVGFKQTSILFDRPPRFAGAGNYNRFFGSLRIGLNGLICFSTYLLTLTTQLGFIIAAMSFLLAVVYGAMKLLDFPFPMGNPTIVILVLFTGGVQLISTGILGEYVARILRGSAAAAESSSSIARWDSPMPRSKPAGPIAGSARRRPPAATPHEGGGSDFSVTVAAGIRRMQAFFKDKQFMPHVADSCRHTLRGHGCWPKKLPALTAEQERIREEFMHLWLSVLPQKYGAIERFNHGYPLRSLQPGARTLEIGGGLGAHLAYEDLSCQQYTVLELRSELVDVLHRRFPQVKAIVGDCQQRLPFADGCFDRILVIHVLEHLPNLPAALDEIHRLLSPQGRFFAVIPCEGGLAYSLARRISARRIFEKKYKQSYDWFVACEHVNRAEEILSELRERFNVVHARHFPLRLPIISANLVIGLTLVRKDVGGPAGPSR